MKLCRGRKKHRCRSNLPFDQLFSICSSVYCWLKSVTHYHEPQKLVSQKKVDATKSSSHLDPSLGLNFRLESDEFSCVTFVLLLGEDNG